MAALSWVLFGMSGRCWEIEENCREEYPCTPSLTVYVASTQAAKVKTRGYIGAAGIGGAEYDLVDTTQLLKIYDDVTGVECGGSTPYSVGATLVFQPSGAGCGMSVTGSFSCSACDF